MAGPWRRQWEGTLRLQRWREPAQEQLREDIESLAEKTIKNTTTPMGDTEAFCDVVGHVDALLQRSGQEKESGRLQLRDKLRRVLQLLQIDANTQQELEQRIVNSLDTLMEYDPRLEPTSDSCVFHVELEGILQRDMDFDLPSSTPESQIQERVAQSLDVHPSQLQILEFRPAAPSGDATLHMCLRMKLQHADYVEQMTAWPEHAKDLKDFIQSLENLPMGSTQDQTWASSGEFAELVRAITPVLTPGATRGSTEVEGVVCEEVLALLKDYMNKHAGAATPAGLLKELSEEFGLSLSC